MRHHRLLCLILAACLIVTQTAQAYSLARLPYQYHHTTSEAAAGGILVEIPDQWGQTR